MLRPRLFIANRHAVISSVQLKQDAVIYKFRNKKPGVTGNFRAKCHLAAMSRDKYFLYSYFMFMR